MNKKKKILFVSQYFYPENFRGNDVAIHLASKGHDVHVVCGTPNYPHGKFYSGYGFFKKRREVLSGVKITRLPIIPRGNNKIMLILNYFSYFIIAWFWVLFHSIGHKYDMVFCQQLSPVMMSSPAILYKRLRKVPLYTWVLDIWPDSLSAAGGISNKYVIRFFDMFVKSQYRHSDKILMSSNSFRRSILTYGAYEEKLIYFPQWADGSSNRNKDMIIPDMPDGFIIMFAGAIGEAHNMEFNLKAALLTKQYKHIHWVYVGDGRKLKWVSDFVSHNDLDQTVHIMGRYPSDMMPLFFQKADVMLVSLSDSSLFNLYCPAKISSYMASGRPIIAVLNGEGADVVRNADCGWIVNPTDAQGLADLAIRLSSMDRSIVSEKGSNGLKYYRKYFEKQRCLNNLDKILGTNI